MSQKQQKKNQDIAAWMRESKPGDVSPQFDMTGRTGQGVRNLVTHVEFRSDPFRMWEIRTIKANKARNAPIVCVVKCRKSHWTKRQRFLRGIDCHDAPESNH